MPSYEKLGEYPNTSLWGKSLIVDVNKALSSIEEHINKGLDQMKNTLKFEVTTAVVVAIDEVLQKAEAANKLAKNNEIRIQNLERKIESVVNENVELKSQIRYVESRDRRCNLLFNGIPEDGTESDTVRKLKVRSVLKDKMDFSENELQNLNMSRCIRINGPKHNAHRSICVTFPNINDRKAVWNARSKLKTVPEYFVCEDYSPEMQRRRRRLYQILNVAKTKPQFKNNTSVTFDHFICFGNIPAKLFPRFPPQSTLGTLANYPQRIRFYLEDRIVKSIHFRTGNNWTHP